MSDALAGATVGLCVYAAVWLASPNLDPRRHIAAAVLFVVAIALAAKYV